ncbi:nitronate monooxygenase (plasmid) [Methylobacterium oryzae CBMB20]
MAGACPPALSVAVAKAGGLGACGALLMRPDEILAWAGAVRAGSNGAFQINTWIPDPAPARDPAHEAQVRDFLGRWGPEVPPEAADTVPPAFDAQCRAILEAGPPIVSSIMGLYAASFVAELKERGIAWFATVTTVAEARAAERAGADAVVAQGSEAGGHRGSFIATALADEDRVELRDFGTFCVRDREGRRARNPRTGREVVVPARTHVHFKPGKAMRARLNLEKADREQEAEQFLRAS